MSQIVQAEGAAIAPAHEAVIRTLDLFAKAQEALALAIPKAQRTCPHMQVLHVQGVRAPAPMLPVRMCASCRLVEIGSAFSDERTWRLFGGRAAVLSNASFRQIVISDFALVESMVLPVGVQDGEIDNLC